MSLSVDEEPRLHTSSGGDWNGQLFTWNGALYRGIAAASAPLYERLFRDGIIASLCEKQLLVETELTDDSPIQKFPLLVRHRTIPFVSYPAEWSHGMLRDAALLIVDLELELVRYGLTIHDAHPWNVVFDGPRPYFVDLGAIMPLEDDSIHGFPRAHPCWPAYAQFRTTLLNPLTLMSWGFSSLARSSLQDYVGISEYEVRKLAPWRASISRPSWDWWAQRMARAVARLAPALRHRVALGAWRDDRPEDPPPLWPTIAVRSVVELPEPAERTRFLERVRDHLDAIREPAGFKKALRDIEHQRQRVLRPPEPPPSEVGGGALTDEPPPARLHLVAEVLSQLRPVSVLDLRCGDGSAALLATDAGARVVACDVDEARVESLYRVVRSRGIELLTLRMDVRSPTPGVGPCNEWLRPATERLSCEMVCAVGLVHRLVFGHHLTFDQISRSLARFSKRWALVEFIAPEDEDARAPLRPEFGWYSREAFEQSLRRYFPLVRALPTPREGGCLLLCDKGSAG